MAGYWPSRFRRSLTVPRTTLATNLAVAALRYGDAPAIHSLGRTLSWREFSAAADAFAGWLQHAGIARGDRVLIYMQNSVQWLIASFGAMRADAVVVPVNPMNRVDELHHYLKDSGARVAVCAQELAPALLGAAGGTSLEQVVVATYSEYVPADSPFTLPDWLHAPRVNVPGCVPWQDVMAAGRAPRAPEATPDDLCLLPYTSGSTGLPKGCMHTSATFMHNVAGLALWHGITAGDPCLGVAPMYHVSGLTHSIHVPVYAGACIVLVPRWERRLAAELIEHYRVVHASMAPTAVIDLLADPELDRRDLSSLRRIGSGGSSMPDEVWKRLNERMGIPYIEAYGMTEAAATTHNNPGDRPKRQCLGITWFDSESCVIDPDTLAVRAVGEPGEILIRGPQMFRGYWNRPGDTAAAWVKVAGREWYRSGDIGYVDEEGYFFMTDRLKRMINASGFKVWPAEVESVLYAHPDVLEACVVGVRDAYRGETVKALLVLRPEARGRLTGEEFTAWAREKMAAYKVPRIVEFVETLPKSPVGKILWREVQDRENARG
ncbi:MAG: long-chain-fatty-acid--CoA ligase [Betaproteobacteria bacterium]